MNDGLHFADNPDDLLCGRAAIRTLCGQHSEATTNWAVEQVTCERCLEVMEDRAAGITRVGVTRVHDEIVFEASWSTEAAPQYTIEGFPPELWAQKILEELKRGSKIMELMRKQTEAQAERQEMLARVKKNGVVD